MCRDDAEFLVGPPSRADPETAVETMNLEDVRLYCVSREGVTEETLFGPDARR